MIISNTPMKSNGLSPQYAHLAVLVRYMMVH